MSLYAGIARIIRETASEIKKNSKSFVDTFPSSTDDDNVEEKVKVSSTGVDNALGGRKVTVLP